MKIVSNHILFILVITLFVIPSAVSQNLHQVTSADGLLEQSHTILGTVS